MRDRARENLVELLRRFMDDCTAQAVQNDIEAGEQILEAHPAPAPSPAALSRVKAMMAATARHRRRRSQAFRRAAAVAAVVVLGVFIGLQDRRPGDRPTANFASIIPTAIWESEDLAVDDLDLVYFTSEIRQIEAQLRALETGETEIRGNDTIDDIEIEMLALETEFWKG